MKTKRSLESRRVDAIDEVDRLSMQAYSKRLHIRLLERQLAGIQKKRAAVIKALRKELDYDGEFQSDAQIERACRTRAKNAKSVADMIRIVLREHWQEIEMNTDEIMHQISLRWPEDNRVTRAKVRTNLDRLALGKEMQIEKNGDTWSIPDIQCNGQYQTAIPSPQKRAHRQMRQQSKSKARKTLPSSHRPPTLLRQQAKSKRRKTATP